MNDHSSPRVATRPIRGGFAAVVAFALLAPPMHALQFTMGEVTGNFDSTISFGGLYRLKNPDSEVGGP